MNLLGLRHLCWGAYIEVGDHFYRSLLPPILKQGLVQEMRRIGIDPSTEHMTLTRISASTAKNIDLASGWRGADFSLIGAVFRWAAPLKWDRTLWPRLTKGYQITVLETMLDPFMLPFRNTTGTIMLRLTRQARIPPREVSRTGTANQDS